MENILVARVRVMNAHRRIAIVAVGISLAACLSALLYSGSCRLSSAASKEHASRALFELFNGEDTVDFVELAVREPDGLAHSYTGAQLNRRLDRIAGIGTSSSEGLRGIKRQIGSFEVVDSTGFRLRATVYGFDCGSSVLVEFHEPAIGLVLSHRFLDVLY